MAGLHFRTSSVILLIHLLVATGKSQSLIPGNLAILRIGDGTQVLTSSGNSLFVDQYSATGALISTMTIPDNGTSALLLSGASGSEGGLTRSWDRSTLVLAGYNTNRGSISGSLSSQSGTAVPRAVATLDPFGNYRLAEASTILYSSNNVRCAASDGTNNFWTAGNPGGTHFLNPPQPIVDLQPSTANTRFVKIVGGAIYFSTQAGTAGLFTFQGGGLPTSAANTVLVLATGANSQPAGFALGPGLTTAYVADQRPNVGGIQRWTNSGSAWGLAYTLSTGAGAFDVAVDFSASPPVVYATTAEASANRLISIADTGPLSIVKVLATAGANRIFKGLDFAPDLRPVILSQPMSQTVTNGSDASFTVVAQSRVALGYQWRRNAVNLSSGNSSTLTLQAVTSANEGSYDVVVTNAYGSITSVVATLTVDQVLVPPTITSQPADQTVALGGTATFSVSATGTPPITYQWERNGFDLANETNSSLTLANLSGADEGAYVVRLVNPGGSTNSQPAVLTVSIPSASFVPYAAPGQVYVQNFDSLPNPGTSSVNADNPVNIGGTIYGVANPFDFTFPILPNGVDATTGVGLGGLGLSNLMPGWYSMGELAPKLGASEGDQSTGGTISYGLTNSASASSNRALGLLATSSSGATAFGLKLINQTTGTLNQITLHFTGELWRQASVQKALSASYWIDPSATNSFSTNVTGLLPNLDVRFAPDPSATNPVPVNGLAPANQISLGVTNQPIADWPAGSPGK